MDRFDKVVWAVILLSGLVSLLLGMATGILIVKLVGGCLVLLSFFTGLGEMKFGIDWQEKDEMRFNRKEGRDQDEDLEVCSLMENRTGKGKEGMSRLKRLREWLGYDDGPLWLCFCRFVFAVSSLACVLTFCGPAILVGDVIVFFAYQEWIFSHAHAHLVYIVAVVVTFTLAVISGIPAILYEKRKMEKSNEVPKKE